MIKRLITSLLTSLLFALLATIGVHQALEIQKTTQAVPSWVLSDVKSFSERLRVKPPVVQYVESDDLARVSCDSDSSCTINLGTLFDVWQKEDRTAAKALLAHEMGHVLQSSQGTLLSYDRAELLYFAVSFAILFLLSNVWTRLAALSVFCCVAVFFRSLNYLTFDQVFPVSLLTFLVPAVATAVLSMFLFALSRKKEQAYRSLGVSSARFALVVSIVGVCWLGARPWAGANQIPLEIAADNISACLTTPAFVVKMGMKLTPSSSYTLPPVYHTSPEMRISAMSAFDSSTCRI